MNLQHLIRNYIKYNAWANDQLIQWLSAQDQNVLYAEIPSSFPSIDKTLQHIWRVQRFWLAFVTNTYDKNFDWSVRNYEVEKVMQDLQQQSHQMKDMVCVFSELELMETLNLDMPWAKNKLPRYEYIQHVVNHSTFHRGQIVSMARGLGLWEGVPASDYNIFNMHP